MTHSNILFWAVLNYFMSHNFIHHTVVEVHYSHLPCSSTAMCTDNILHYRAKCLNFGYACIFHNIGFGTISYLLLY